MVAISYLDDMKNSVYGIVLLGAFGSLLATVIALLMKYFIDQHRRLNKATGWNFGWMNAFCSKDILHHPIYLTFVAAHVCKIIIQCTACIFCVLLTFVVIVKSDSLNYYLLSVLIFSFGILFFIRSYSDYKSINASYRLWINKLGEEDKRKLVGLGSSVRPDS